MEQFSDSATDVADPQRKDGAPLISNQSQAQATSIAVPQRKEGVRLAIPSRSPIQSEILNLKQREQYSDSATVVVSVDLQKLNERIAKLLGGVAAIQDCTTHELYESNSIPERDLYCFSDFHFAVTAADPPPLLVVVVRDCARNYPRMASSSSSSSSSKPRRPASSSSKLPPKLPKEEIIVGGIAKTCWVKFRQEATFALYTPFIVCVASRTLEVETLRQCIAQDVHFLKPFDKAFELAETYAVDDDDRREVNKLRKITKKKLNLHDYFVQEWESDVDATPNPTTSKCTDFLLATAWGKIDGIKPLAIAFTPYEKTKLAAYILGAITSCISLNAFIGKEVPGILCEHHQSNHPYKKWIENYSSDSFQDFCLQTEELLDNLSVVLTGEVLGIIERLYCQGIKHETEFLLAQPVIEKAVVPLSGKHNRVMIFSGFDLTCSFVDSSAILAELTIATAPKSDQIPIESQFARMTLSDLRDNWEVIANKYTNGYEQCIEKLLLATEKAKKLNKKNGCIRRSTILGGLNEEQGFAVAILLTLCV